LPINHGEVNYDSSAWEIHRRPPRLHLTTGNANESRTSKQRRSSHCNTSSIVIAYSLTARKGRKCKVIGSDQRRAGQGRKWVGGKGRKGERKIGGERDEREKN